MSSNGCHHFWLSYLRLHVNNQRFLHWCDDEFHRDDQTTAVVTIEIDTCSEESTYLVATTSLYRLLTSGNFLLHLLICFAVSTDFIRRHPSHIVAIHREKKGGNNSSTDFSTPEYHLRSSRVIRLHSSRDLYRSKSFVESINVESINGEILVHISDNHVDAVFQREMIERKSFQDSRCGWSGRPKS